jgi:hypothetical protein
VFSLFVKLGLQFLNLSELRSLVCFERLGSAPCTRVRCMGWCGVPTSSGSLSFRIRRDGPINLEALAGRIVTVVGRVGVRGTKVVVRRMHVRSSIAKVIVARGDRTELRARGLRRVQVLGSWRGCHEVKGRT